jgi:Tfp pilus assembly protein PilZ
MIPRARRLHSIALNLEAAQYLQGWRADAVSLFLPALSDGRVGDEVAARVGIFGQDIRATIFGSIALVRRVGRPSLPPGVEIALDRMSLPAAQFLAAAAKGEKLSYRERAPRHVLATPLRVTREGVEQTTATLNISEGGCAVSWAGPLPLVGEVLAIRLGEGLFSKALRAVVCWNSPGGAVQRCAGLRILAEGRGGRAWKAIVEQAAKSGGRTA